MVFKRQDIYTSSGTVMLQNSWTPYVSKYDTSSFYNWEQDNLPLYDLEERDYELWEQAGFPTSAVPGLSLTVSAATPAATLAANNTIFTTVSSCIAAVPKVVRFPVLIEVCNFGDLGDLELHNFRIEEGGSIEIINRAYTKVYTASGAITTVVAAPTYNRVAPLIQEITSQDVSSTLFSGIANNGCTSGLNLSTRVLSGTDDVRVSSVNSFLYPRLTLDQAPLSVSLSQDNGFFTGVLNKFKLDPYENTNTTSYDDTIMTLDFSATNQATGDFIRRDPIVTGAARVGGSVYMNTLKKVSIQNCDGPIYVRNFCVNGESVVGGGRDVGIEVNNSDVLLENCAAVRCREAGFKFNNSKVVLSRSAFSYRNYELETTTTRTADKGIGFHAINTDLSISSLVSGTFAQEHYNNPYAGDFQASGEDVIVAASRNTIGIRLDNSKLHGGFAKLFRTDEDSGGITTCEVNTNVGLQLNESQVNLNGLLDIYGNDVGVDARGSEVEFENLCGSFHTNQALRSKNSTFVFDSPNSPTNAGQDTRHQVEFKGNGQHLALEDESSFIFARKDNIPAIYGNMQFSGCHGVIKYLGTNRANLPAISVDNNSVLNLIHADIRSRIPADTVAGVPTYGMAIKASNNSVASLFGTGSGCNFVWGPAGYTYQKYVAGLYGDNGSEINLHGPTVVAQFGVDGLVENNSTLNIQPPRVRDAYGVEASAFDLDNPLHHTAVELHSTRACLVANKNSNINLADLGAYGQQWGRTTAGVELIDDGLDYPIGIDGYNISSLLVSGSLQFFPNPQDSSAITSYHLADLENSNGVNLTIPDFPIFTDSGSLLQFIITGGFADGKYGTGAGSRQWATQGGTCIRATGDSVVNSINVHFPFGANNSPMDGTYYTTSGSDCDKLMIWNIADTSRLNASYCSVSGMYPADTQFHGPSSIWASSVNGGAGGLAGPGKEVAAYGAPALTPDTGALSVLDTFGAGSSVWLPPSGTSVNVPFNQFFPVSGAEGLMFGDGFNTPTVSALVGAGINVSATTTYQYGADPNTSNNQGVFRIYWTPKGSARFLQNDLSGYMQGAYPNGVAGAQFSGVVGPAYQIFSQGYNCSAPLSGLVPAGEVNASSLAPDLLKFSYDTNNDGCPDALWTSGFYYCQEMVESNPTQCMLDESAAKTFANAQNASLGDSGRPRKVTLFRSRNQTSRASEAYTGDLSGTLGFKSAGVFDLKRDN